eukprot:PRCOL_00007281-RA
MVGAGAGVEHVFVGPDRVRLCLRALLGPAPTWEDEADLWRELHGTYGALLEMKCGWFELRLGDADERVFEALDRVEALCLARKLRHGWF